MQFVDDVQRRARLGVRHALASRARADTPQAAAEAVVCLHATEPATVYLSAFARSGADREAIDRALYDDRTLVRQLAMRRTVFAFPRALLPAVRGSAGARVARQQAARLAKEVEAGGLAADGPTWVEQTCGAVLDQLNVAPATTRSLRERLPALGLRLQLSPGKSYGGEFPVAPRVLAVLAAEGGVVRGHNDAGWKVSRPFWTPVGDWLGEDLAPLDASAGYATLVRRWLRQFGPGTEDDLVWWLGATKGAVRAALAAVGAVEVTVSDGPAYLLEDDLDPVDPPAPWAALLPALDPTTMGWRHRDWYLAPHRDEIFDRNGNAGQTAWWCGRVVGGWHQTPEGEVVVVPLEDVGQDARSALDAEAARLQAWLEGDVVSSIYKSPLHRQHLR